jgi:hypothetical protein
MFSYIIDRTRCLLMMMVDLEFYSTRSLKQQSLCRYAAPFGHDIYRLRTNQYLLVQINVTC